MMETGSRFARILEKRLISESLSRLSFNDVGLDALNVLRMQTAASQAMYEDGD